jgi:hypothetical protein
MSLRAARLPAAPLAEYVRGLRRFQEGCSKKRRFQAD